MSIGCNANGESELIFRVRSFVSRRRMKIRRNVTLPIVIISKTGQLTSHERRM